MQATENYPDLHEFFSKQARPPEPPGELAGEWLVQEKLLTRHQLLRALQLQDQIPGIRLGDCVVALGFATRDSVQDIVAVHRALAELEDED